MLQIIVVATSSTGDDGTSLSCRSISNLADWRALYIDAEQAAIDAGYRSLILVESGRSAVDLAAASPSLSDSNEHSAPGVPGIDARRRADRVDVMTAQLGQEFERVVHDARLGFDPDMLSTDVGALRRGGVLILLLPHEHVSRYAARTVRLLERHTIRHPSLSWHVRIDEAIVDAVSDLGNLEARLTPGAPSPEPGTVQDGALTNHLALSRSNVLQEQDGLLGELERYLLSGKRTLAIIEAPRGHGKSSLLGRLAARLDARDLSWQVTAARRESLVSLARHWRAEGGNLAGYRMPFAASDAVRPDRADVLLIDEAASLPLPLLEQFVDSDTRVVMATTTDGNEAAGRAFALRCPDTFDRYRPGWRHFSPARPWRWQPGDPLATLLDTILISDAAAQARQPLNMPADELPRLRDISRVHELDRETLIDDEESLRALHGLLSATHYQSKLSDIARLLDTPAMRVWTIMRQGRCIAAALVSVEGGLEKHIHDDILARRRRPRHCLLPVLLAQIADTGVALDAALARVVRIAVHPDARRLGLGRYLLEEMTHDLGTTVEGIGASFGENIAARSFWEANGFTPFHRGFRRNPRSGQHSVAVLRALSHRTRIALGMAADVHRDNHQHIDVSGRRHSNPMPSGSERDTAPLTMRDSQLLTRFANAERSLHDSMGPLRRLLTRQGHSAHDVHHALVSGEPAHILQLLDIDRPPSRRQCLALLQHWVLQRTTPVVTPDKR